MSVYFSASKNFPHCGEISLGLAATQQHCWSGPVRWPGYNLCVARGGGSAIANTQGLFNNQESVPVAAVAALRTRGPGRPERLRLDPVRITLNASSGTRDLIPSARWTTGQQRGSGSGSSPFSSSSVRSSRQIIKIIFLKGGSVHGAQHPRNASCDRHGLFFFFSFSFYSFPFRVLPHAYACICISRGELKYQRDFSFLQ